MELAAWLAGLGGVAALVSSLVAVAARRDAKAASSDARDATNVQQVFEAQARHIDTLARENAGYLDQVRGMRREIESHRQQIAALHEDRSKCERDKVVMSGEIASLAEQLRDLQERLPGG